jgi:cullin-4
LYDAVEAVYLEHSFTHSHEQLYRLVESLCLHQKAATLYQQLIQQCDKHIHQHLSQLTITVSLPPLQYLPTLEKVWSKHCLQLLTIRTIFLYLDRTYVIQTLKSSIWEKGVSLFGNHLKQLRGVHPPSFSNFPGLPHSPEIPNIISHSMASLQDYTLHSLLELVTLERKGEHVPSSLLKILFRMIVTLHLYNDEFEPRFLAASKSHFSLDAAQQITSNSLSDYLSYAWTQFRREADRVHQYLQARTLSPLLSILEHSIIVDQLPSLLNENFVALLINVSISDLQRLYSFIARVDKRNQLSEVFGNYVKEQTIKILGVGDERNESKDSTDKKAIEKAINPNTIMVNLLQFQSQLDSIVTSAFSKDPDITKAMKSAIEYALNYRTNESKSPEYIAKYIDSLFRNTTLPKCSTLSQFDAQFELVLYFFRFIHSKDVFQAHYRKDLAKRLLQMTNFNTEAETTFLEKLKAECGSVFVSKFENMLKDMEVSKEVMQQYNQHLTGYGVASMAVVPSTLHVHILTTGSWPSYPIITPSLPQVIENLQTDFTQFYQNKYNGRKLTWQYTLGSAVLRANFPRTKKEFQVNALQAIVLLLFNEMHTTSDSTMSDSSSSSIAMDKLEDRPTSIPTQISKPSDFPIQYSLSFNAILEKTKLSVADCKRTLQSLACNDVAPILRKHPRNKKVMETDLFAVDLNFRSNLYRIKIPTLQLKETVEETNAALNTKIREDRAYALDAAIVRIMKSRKMLSHNELMSEVYSLMKFPVTTTDIKTRIATLIDREYMERDPENPSVYRYQA